ncbi:MAG: hypothetical protein ABEK12_01995 [Candidatus Nanohaloarchaea archaeon]
MSILRRAKKVDDRLSESDHVYRVKEVLDILMPPVLVLLLAALYLEFMVPLTHAQEVQVLHVEQGILLYFLVELAVDLAIYEDNRQYLRDRWVDILLVLPFVTVIRGVGGVLRIVKGVKSAKVFKPFKVAKTVKAGKASKVSKVAEEARLFRGARGTQHASKAVKKGKDLVLED